MSFSTAVLIFIAGLAGGFILAVALICWVVHLGREAQKEQERNQPLLDRAAQGVAQAREMVQKAKEEELNQKVAGSKWHASDEKDWH